MDGDKEYLPASISRDRENCVISGDEFVQRAAEELNDILREAAWGRARWDDACRRLAEALPGSALGVVNYDLPRASINAAFAHGMDWSFVESYRDYYASLNPWLGLWESGSPGQVRVSERESPSAAFRDTEFYTDWLAPQGNLDAVVGARLDIDEHNSVVLAWHYGVGSAARYDPLAQNLLERLMPTIEEVVRGAVLLRSGLEDGLRLGPLLESISGAAFLLDRERRIREANREGASALSEGSVLTGTGNTLAIRDHSAQRWLEEAVARLADGQALAAHTNAFSFDDRVFSITLTRAPDQAEASLARLVRARPSVLAVVRLLAGGPMRVDEAALRFAYGLSGAEIRLCQTLLDGRSLAEAAQILGISDGTVRQRVKLVFNKTRTHRQGELVALLARFAAPSWSA